MTEKPLDKETPENRKTSVLKGRNKNNNETYRIEICDEHVGQRIDKALGEICEDLSRARIQSLIQERKVKTGNDIVLSVSQKLNEGDKIEIEIPPPVKADPQPENIRLDIVYEDSDVLVINKQAGLVVHPGAGNHTGTLVNALLHHCGESLSGIGGVMRPGIVHRIDKDTSGLLIVAKNDRAHQGLAKQLEARTLSRTYQALVMGVPVPKKGSVDQPIGRQRGNRQKMAVTRSGGKQAKTHYETLETYSNACSLLECRLESGRTHQIRVHMAFLKHPLIGDPLYGPQPTALSSILKKAGYKEDICKKIRAFERQALHASEIVFIHPVSEKEMMFSAPLPTDFSDLLAVL